MSTRRRTTAMKKNTVPFRHLREAFAVYNKTNAKSPHTVKWYEFRLELFERYLGPGACLDDLTIEKVRAYVAELQDREVLYANNPRATRQGRLSSAYIQGFVRAFRAFATWLQLDGYTRTNVLRSMKPPRVQQKVVEVLTEAEIGRLFAVLDRDDAFGARDYTIVWTMLDCGLRASEVCNLRTEDAHLAQGYLKVLGKGNKERLVPIGRSSQDALLRWRDRFRPRFEFVESPFMFLSSAGRPLTVASLEELVHRLGERANVKRVHCHLLRHTFATNYLVRQVGDPLRLQQILGQTSLEMARRYVSISTVQQNLIEARTSPWICSLRLRSSQHIAATSSPADEDEIDSSMTTTA